ncbi:MAG TPA: RNA polymerase sigma factor region1.1 domain-containing protein, partial [Abditibacteriaceae bacterium]|nr:RNA polymerase sigma factor region1.1 domain-containing protein [Abditibacteriaceae bacterium]
MQQPRVQRLVAEGAQSGQLSYHLINEVLGDLQIEPEDAEALLEALENRGIKIVDDPAVAAATGPARVSVVARPVEGSTAPVESTPVAKSPAPRSRHSDLDAVLASLESLSRDPALDLRALADSESALSESALSE